MIFLHTTGNSVSACVKNPAGMQENQRIITSQISGCPCRILFWLFVKCRGGILGNTVPLLLSFGA